VLNQSVQPGNTQKFFSDCYFLPFNNLDNLALFRCDFNSAFYRSELYATNNIKFPPSIQKSVQKRQAEYLAGRYAATMALKKIGIDNIDIAIGKHRSPVWPENIIASITHNNNSALCIAAIKQNYTHLGLDIENWIKHETVSEIKDSIIQYEEEVLLHRTLLEFDKALTLAFSAKESLFKALYPTVGYYFDFSAAEICNISVENRTFELILSQDLTPQLITGTRFHGTFIFDSTGILTLVQQCVKT
jgi:enterobactin synthetase component D